MPLSDLAEPSEVEHVPTIARVTLNLPQAVWETLSRIAAAQGVTKTEGIRRSISAYLLLHEAVQGKDKVILQHPDGSAETVRVVY